MATELANWDLSGLTWDAATTGDPPSVMRAPSICFAVPASLTLSIVRLRQALESHGVGLVPEDALVMSLGNRVYFDWAGEDRALLAPMTQFAVAKAVRGHVLRAGIPYRSSRGRGLLRASAFSRRAVVRDA